MKVYWMNCGGWSFIMAVGLWLGTGCIIIEETVLEYVVGLMWHGKETSSGPFCELPGGGFIKGKEIVHHKSLASQGKCCRSDIVISDTHKC